MSGPVPVAAALEDIYPPASVAAQAERWSALAASFEREFGHPHAFVARSPGRVNIIGEHIDYSLYSVLPMAITDDAIIAVRATPAAPAPDASSFRVRIRNVLGHKFPPRVLDVPIGRDVDIDSTQFEWTNYFKSGLRGALELLYRKRGPAFRPVDMDVLMDGTVPVGGGLSSSAAFVSASALAVMVANGEDVVDKKELTELAIMSHISSMDQSASVFSERGSATLVSFSPELAAQPIKFPPTSPELCFVIAQSFVTSNKHVTGPIHYNLRVVEVSFAAAYLNALLNPAGTQLPADAGPLGISLHGFHQAYLQHHGGGTQPLPTREAELRRMIELTEATLTREDGYTRDDIASVLGLSVDALEARFMSKFPVRADRFKLRQRALHVFTEALRVLEFLDVLQQSNAAQGAADPLSARLGRLMNETQDSCRDLFDCSCPELDNICRISRAAGAYAARLTGAGWGGCTVHLVPADRVAAVKQALEAEYYSKLSLTEEQKAQAVVVSRPACGSAIYRSG
ncbi:Galactokinase [Escovopsis weberi]|uniref:Galactokinase n=1 Tax=Escovopsis weberi TaxID=150374 RepID=A0A0M9VWQ7_ESCWE|nr:Galactokinase [Escovopsis weberi]